MRLLFRRELREELSRSGNHVIGEERVRVERRREETDGETGGNRVHAQGPVDNVTADQPLGARVTSASTPTVEDGAIWMNWEEVVRRTLFRVSREEPSRPLNATFSEPTLSRPSRRDRESGRELSVMRSHGFSDTESSSSDSEDDREVAATAPGAAFSGTDGRDARGRHRPDSFRPGNAVKAFKDWHISFSGSSSDDAEEFLERIREMQRYYRLRDVDILEAVPCALTERALQWFRSVGHDVR